MFQNFWNCWLDNDDVGLEKSASVIHFLEADTPQPLNVCQGSKA
jgi:hypothetical protein